MRKLLLFFFLVLSIAGASALQFGNETETAFIKDGSFKMMQEPELDSQFFLQFQLVDENSVSLENYHSELKIYDNRGVQIYPNAPFALSYSDSNGFINFNIILLESCNFFNQSQCFQLDQNYTVEVSGKGFYQKEYFTTKLKRIRTNWAGDFIRFFYVNNQAIFILLLIAFVLLMLFGYAYSIIFKGGK